jgi:hypothetical protein
MNQLISIFRNLGLTGVLILSVSFQSSAQTANDLKKILEPSYGNWKLADKSQTYNPENLYDFINGAADNFLSYDFQELQVFTYEQAEKYINLEIYIHKGLPQAFGIYSSEKPGDGKFENIGVQGYVGQDMCNFYTGNYYVKISTHESNPEIPEILRKMAKDLAQRLVKNPECPKAIVSFPVLDKVPNSESYTNTNFLGYESLHSAYVATYKKGDKSFKVFIIELLSADAAKTMVTKYASAIKASFSGNEGIQQFKDPYNGDIKLEWKGNFIWGILNDQKAKIKDNYLDLTRAMLFGK